MSTHRGVVILARSLLAGGAERQIALLARELLGRGVPVTVLLFYGGGALHEELVAAGVPCEVLGKRGRWHVLGFLVRLVRVLRRCRPAALYSFLVVPNVIAALVRPLLPGTRLVWGVRSSRMDLTRYDWFARVTFAASVGLARVPDVIVCNSEAGRRDHAAAGYSSRRLVVVPNGIDAAFFQRREADAARLREVWNVPSGVPLVGLVARLDPKKGHEIFVEAAALLWARWPDARFVCVGMGSPGRAVELAERATAAGLHGQLAWVGQHDDMAAVYSALDVLCLTSRFGEGFPNVLGEALACGTPVVATDVGDAAVVVGDGGIVVPPGSAEAVANGLDNVLRALAEDAAACRARARAAATRFSVGAMVDGTLAALGPLA